MVPGPDRPAGPRRLQPARIGPAGKAEAGRPPDTSRGWSPPARTPFVPHRTPPPSRCAKCGVCGGCRKGFDRGGSAVDERGGRRADRQGASWASLARPGPWAGVGRAPAAGARQAGSWAVLGLSGPAAPEPAPRTIPRRVGPGCRAHSARLRSRATSRPPARSSSTTGTRWRLGPAVSRRRTRLRRRSRAWRLIE